MKINALNQLTHSLDDSKKMPVLFLGHGSPMNAIEENEFVKALISHTNTRTLFTAYLRISIKRKK